MLSANFRLTGPDNDGDQRANTRLTVTNDGAVPSGAIRTCCAVTRGTTVVTSTEEWQTVSLEPGENTSDVDPSLGYLNQKLIGTDPAEVQLHVLTTLYSVAEFDLGRIPVPAGPGATETLAIPEAPAATLEVLSAYVLREEPDSDGDIRLKACCAIRTRDVYPVDRIELQMDLLSGANACMETDTTTVSLKGNSIELLECSFLRKERAFRHKQIQVSLRVFMPLQRDSAIAVATMEEESDSSESFLTSEIDPDDPSHTIITLHMLGLSDDYDPECWTWEEAFEKRGFNDGDGEVHTEEVAQVIKDAGYAVSHEKWGVHNVVIASIKKGRKELMPGEWDDPRSFLPEELVQLLDERFPENNRG